MADSTTAVYAVIDNRISPQRMQMLLLCSTLDNMYSTENDEKDTEANTNAFTD
jgi:hypothetical protein